MSNSQLIIQNEELWQDDFQYDPNGLSGWNIVKTSVGGYDIPTSNPIIYINSIPKYHGPFPQKYKLERQVTCDTTNATVFYASYSLQHCNTNKNDISYMKIQDSSQNDIFTPIQTKLNNGNLLTPSHLPSVHNATSMYYNHSSSATNTPYCANTSVNQWYSLSSITTSPSVALIGGRTYHIIFEMELNNRNEYVLISDVWMSCIDVSTTETPTSNPTTEPTTYPSAQPSTNPTIYPTTNPTIYPTTNPTTVPTVNPTVFPTANPTVLPTVNPTVNPTQIPSSNPTVYPTSNPTVIPTIYPTMYPSAQPTYSSIHPSLTPTETPTNRPTRTIITESTVHRTTDINTPYISEVAAQNRKEINLFYIYITLGILSFLATILCICCIIFWGALHLHKKTVIEDLKKSTESANDNHREKKDAETNIEIETDKHNDTKTDELEDKTAKKINKINEENESNFSDVINDRIIEMIEYDEHNFGEYNHEYNHSDDVINLQYKPSDTTHTSF